MIRKTTSRAGLGFVLFLLLAEDGRAQAPLTVNGVSDRGDYNSNSITLSVPAASGYTYSVKLDGERIGRRRGNVLRRKAGRFCEVV